MNITYTDFASCREQIQEDLLCLLEAGNNLGVQNFVEELKTAACQIVVKNFKKLEKTS
jgi:hypothetical protein